MRASRAREKPAPSGSVVPASPADAKGLLKTVLRADNPTFFLEAGGRGAETAAVPDDDYTIPLGKAAVLREGRDVTIVAIGTMVKHGVAAAAELAGKGIDAELIDVRSLVPFDEDTVLASVRKTGRLVVADEARDRCSAASHICAVVADKGFGSLKAAPKRVTVPNVAMPYAPNAEKNVLPNATKIAEAAAALVNAKAGS